MFKRLLLTALLVTSLALPLVTMAFGDDLPLDHKIDAEDYNFVNGLEQGDKNRASEIREELGVPLEDTTETTTDFFTGREITIITRTYSDGTKIITNITTDNEGSTIYKTYTYHPNDGGVTITERIISEDGLLISASTLIDDNNDGSFSSSYLKEFNEDGLLTKSNSISDDNNDGVYEETLKLFSYFQSAPHSKDTLWSDKDISFTKSIIKSPYPYDQTFDSIVEIQFVDGSKKLTTHKKTDTNDFSTTTHYAPDGSIVQQTKSYLTYDDEGELTYKVYSFESHEPKPEPIAPGTFSAGKDIVYKKVVEKDTDGDGENEYKFILKRYDDDSYQETVFFKNSDGTTSTTDYYGANNLLIETHITFTPVDGEFHHSVNQTLFDEEGNFVAEIITFFTSKYYLVEGDQKTETTTKADGTIIEKHFTMNANEKEYIVEVNTAPSGAQTKFIHEGKLYLAGFIDFDDWQYEKVTTTYPSGIIKVVIYTIEGGTQYVDKRESTTSYNGIINGHTIHVRECTFGGCISDWELVE